MWAKSSLRIVSILSRMYELHIEDEDEHEYVHVDEQEDAYVRRIARRSNAAITRQDGHPK